MPSTTIKANIISGNTIKANVEAGGNIRVNAVTGSVKSTTAPDVVIKAFIKDQGPIGPKGEDSTVPGPKGDKGDTGDDSTVPGPQGEAATLDVGTTTTGDAGTSASVVNSGTTSDAVFDFTIPKGDKGDTGLTGSKGDKGDKGDTGAQGIQGIQGIKGDKGDTGTAGTNGTNGTNGTDGDDAYVYIAYASDDTGTGFTLTFNSALDYIAVKNTTTAIASPVASDFTGLWKKYKGETGPAGAGTGDVLGPASNTADYLPQWNGANSKTLKDGVAIPAGGLAGLTALGTKQDQLNGTGFVKATGTSISYDNSTYLTSLSGALLATGATTGATSQSQTFTNGITLEAGTTTIAPIKMTSGTNLTTPVAGVFEFDGTNLYFSI